MLTTSCSSSRTEAHGTTPSSTAPSVTTRVTDPPSCYQSTASFPATPGRGRRSYARMAALWTTFPPGRGRTFVSTSAIWRTGSRARGRSAHVEVNAGSGNDRVYGDDEPTLVVDLDTGERCGYVTEDGLYGGRGNDRLLSGAGARAFSQAAPAAITSEAGRPPATTGSRGAGYAPASVGQTTCLAEDRATTCCGRLTVTVTSSSTAGRGGGTGFPRPAGPEAEALRNRQEALTLVPGVCSGTRDRDGSLERFARGHLEGCRESLNGRSRKPLSFVRRFEGSNPFPSASRPGTAPGDVGAGVVVERPVRQRHLFCPRQIGMWMRHAAAGARALGFGLVAFHTDR